MYISKLSLVNYRNFARTSFLFNKGVNTIIGENGSGKSNAFRAIRLLLDDNMLRLAFKLEEQDFNRKIGDWRGHWIVISAEFSDIGPDEAIQALFLHGTAQLQTPVVKKATYNLIFRPKKDVRLKFSALKALDTVGMNAIREQITIDDYETLFTGRSTADFTNEVIYKSLVGDFEKCIFNNEIDSPTIGARLPTFLSVSKEISLSFVQALRDVVAEFHNNRTNPLLKLLKSKSGEIPNAVMLPIVTKVQELNQSIEKLDDVQTIRVDIKNTIKDTVGETYAPNSLSIRSDLPEEADKLFQSLKLFIGESDESYEGAIHELSLGGANLIFLTLKLLEFKYQKEKNSIANFLLIEEPEAHIHTHIQKSLFDKLNYIDTQIIYSTHSTHISEVSNVENINVIGFSDGVSEAFQPSTDLSPNEIERIQRYLDAVRNNLLFAKSVVLIEGDAEEILIPILFKKVLGLSLDELGISLINIRSTGFKNVAQLFHDTRIRKNCAIITDLDSSFINTIPEPLDTPVISEFKKKCASSEASGKLRKSDLDSYTLNNIWLSVHYAEHTFEVDFIKSGNGVVVSNVVDQVYVDPKTISLAKTELTSGVISDYGKRVLTMASNCGKGWFAILLGKHVTTDTIIPKYIYEAIFTAKKELGIALINSIYRHRLISAFTNGNIDKGSKIAAEDLLDSYLSGNLNLQNLKISIQLLLPNDQVHNLLQDVT
ncbi:ATP-dependent endonuclease [Rheinheimera sp. D18]|uniref:ATP-dependent nuclease n=1 Tax=Rheinheimera sp. D18 TaxID=2545632 RepID=UPI0010505856|nr:AAA family ATPase [Rheinheimera sp. D18]QBL08418.1 ATP-dependent endonuclease [Rheinheimera sp. D18]